MAAGEQNTEIRDKNVTQSMRLTTNCENLNEPSNTVSKRLETETDKSNNKKHITSQPM